MAASQLHSAFYNAEDARLFGDQVGIQQQQQQVQYPQYQRVHQQQQGRHQHQEHRAHPQQTSTNATQTADLWLKIDQLHLNYLKSEDSTTKIEIRKKLEGYTHHYLCVVPHERKFCNPITSEVMHESIRWIPDFSALRAGQAFLALEVYAANLINQPWRKEFKEIKQYGGFYKHQLEGALCGAERVFHLMGYLSSGQHSLIMDSSVDQDKVITVARDCLLAYVECQIMVSVMQGVSAQFPCTWDEVLGFRRAHVGPPEQAVRALVYHKNQMTYQTSSIAQGLQQSQTPSSSSGDFRSISTVTTPQPNNVLIQGGTIPQAAMYDGSSPAPVTPPVQPAVGRLIEFDDGPSSRSSFASQGRQISRSKRNNSGGSSSSGGSTLNRQQQAQIPLTVKHLEEEQRLRSIHQNGLPTTSPSPLLPPVDGDSPSMEDQQRHHFSRHQEVFALLNSYGNSRQDMLALLNQVSLARQREGRDPREEGGGGSLSPLSPKDQELLRQLNRTSLDDRSSSNGYNDDASLHPQEQHNQEDEVDAVHHRFRRNAGDVSDSAVSGHTGTNRHHHGALSAASKADPHKSRATKSLRHSRPMEPPPSTSDHVSPPDNSTRARRLDLPNVSPKPRVRRDDVSSKAHVQEDAVQSSSLPAWQCYACTYENSAQSTICVMCGKSRDSPDFSDDKSLAVSADQTSMVECRKCTLLNPRNQRRCEACNAFLTKRF